MSVPELRTERLLLREWRDDDLEPFAALNADPEAMRHFPKLLTREESDERVRQIREHFERHGFGLWAVEIRNGTPFIGFVGLSTPRFEPPFTPFVEVGWRLARQSWGHGFATEGARAALAFGFERLGLPEIVSSTVPDNVRSRRVMERLGMTRDPADDFDHPLLAEGHPLRKHVLYRLRRPAFEKGVP
jgi:RimJ/RimL family protein N-acetyltransferase